MLKFSYEEVNDRYEEFVKNFLADEQGVEKTKLLPRLYSVVVPSKDFSVMVTCENISNFDDVEQWAAVVEETNGEKCNFVLFEKEIEEWSREQRELKGIN